MPRSAETCQPQTKVSTGRSRVDLPPCTSVSPRPGHAKAPLNNLLRRPLFEQAQVGPESPPG